MIKKIRCPFMYEPFEDCYCVDLSSQNIERALYFCGKNFVQCEIYLRNKLSRWEAK